MALLVKLLSKQHGFVAGVSKEWRNAWGDFPKSTQAITADTTVSQLQWSFDGGLKKVAVVCERIAEHCDVGILQYANSKGCPVSRRAFFTAAARGNFEMIQWALGENCFWRYMLCQAAYMLCQAAALPSGRGGGQSADYEVGAS